MTSNGGGDRGLQQVNHHHVKEENGIVGDGWGLYRDGELWVNKSDENVKDRGGEAVQGEFVVHTPQLQPQGTLVQWEKFLHVRSIKVMLVENDDSTRHIVTALLRNCNYEVIEAANGLQAWKILEDLTNHIDIVLTEVAMPVVSGVGLLCKIMSHKTRKSIPVIMMSSHDSMGLVFKCLSKGAVDFLVKPIRKNELKNLWQHVWRRCQSSSGSGSESFTETQKSVKSRSSLRSDNNSGSNDGEDSCNNGLSTGDGSDDGSGLQSSWTKQAVDVDSSQAASQRGQKAECPDSTCGQVIRSNAGAPGIRDTHGHQELYNVAKGKGLVIGKSRNYEMLHKSQNTLQELDPALNSKRKDKGRENRSSECSSHKHTAVGHNTADSQRDSGEFEEPANVEIKNCVTDDSNEGAVIEHSLKRFREVKDMDKTVQYDRNVLRHSELSAFSRYNTGVHAFKAPNRISRSSSQLDDRLEITKKESTFDGRSCSDGYFVTPSSEGNMGSTTDKLRTNPVVQKDNGLHPSSGFRPIKTDIRPTSQQVLPGKVNDMTLTSILDPQSDPYSELPIQHIHHHHHVHHYHDMEGGQQLLSSPDDLSLKKLAADAPHCGSSNVLGGVSGPVECNPGDYSLNRSVSGSKHGSNGQNGSSTVMNAGGTNVESIVGVAQKTGNADDSGSGSRNGINQSKSAQREAALTKFRQKRKERYFQKKVRYQNRKRLAEQRPGVRGQFVRQTDNDNSGSAADS